MYDLVANVILDASVTAPGAGEGSSANGANASKGQASTAGAGAGNDKVSWRIQLHDKAMSAENEKLQHQRGPEWLEIQDLFVERAESETLFTREGYLMVWERRKVGGKKGKEKAK